MKNMNEQNAIEMKLPPRYQRAEQILETLFEESARPSLRWLRSQQKARKIPSIKIGRLIFFNPEAVRAALDAQAARRFNSSAI
jgi:hypothetical protein